MTNSSLTESVPSTDEPRDTDLREPGTPRHRLKTGTWDMEAAIEISAVTKRYEHFTLQDVSLQVPVGGILGLIGRNGAGKTTLFNCVLNLVRKDCGSVCLPGVTGDISGEKIRRYIGYLPERLTFYEWMDVEALLRFISKFYERWDEKRCRSLMARFALEPNRKIREISLGMRKKLGLMIALSHHPRVLLLDEPTSGLDPVMKFHLLHDLREMVESGETQAILISSHNLDEVDRLVDQIAILRSGALRCCEPRCDLLKGWNKLVFLQPARPDWTETVREKIHTLGANQAMIVSREDIGIVVNRLTSMGGSIREIGRPSLEEVFLELA